MRCLVESSAGRFAFDIPHRGWRPASYVLFDAEGKEIGSAKWFARLEIAWALQQFADLPGDEAAIIEKRLVEAWEANQFAKPS